MGAKGMYLSYLFWDHLVDWIWDPNPTDYDQFTERNMCLQLELLGRFGDPMIFRKRVTQIHDFTRSGNSNP